MTRVRVKICCIGSVREARLAIAAGADALGLVASMPSGPGVIPEPLIAEIAAAVPPPIATFLLTSAQDVGEIVAQVQRCQTNTVQLCDRLESGTFAELRAGLPGVRIVQVVHVQDDESVSEALGLAPRVDALLLDSGRPGDPTKQLGGTGRVHDWQVSRRIVERAEAPVFLAGGLRPDNVGEATRVVRPFGVDVCSGVRGEEGLSPARLSAFCAAVTAAGA